MTKRREEPHWPPPLPQEQGPVSAVFPETALVDGTGCESGSMQVRLTETGSRIGGTRGGIMGSFGTRGIVLRLGHDNAIIEVIHHAFPEAPDWFGVRFESLLIEVHRRDALGFLEAVRKHGAAFDVEFTLCQGLVPHRFTGVRDTNELLICGAPVETFTSDLFNEIARLSEQSLVLRNSVKAGLMDDMAAFEEMTRLNNELAATQREASRASAEIARLYEVERRRTAGLGRLHQAASGMLATLDLGHLLDSVVDGAMALVPQSARGIAMLIGQSPEAEPALAARGFEVPGPQAALLRALRNAAVAGAEPSSPTGIEEFGRGSALIVPMHAAGVPTAVAALFADEPQAFDDQDQALLDAFCDAAVLAIHNARLHAQVQLVAVTDALTGIYNRRGFLELAEREVARCARYKRPLSALMIDIDYFKNVNDTYGHAAGDAVLREVAATCKAQFRSSDIVGRLGGEEFCVLLTETAPTPAAIAAERVRRCVEQKSIEVGGEHVAVTVSIGVAGIDWSRPSLTGLLQAADRALYDAKRGGRNRSVVAG